MLATAATVVGAISGIVGFFRKGGGVGIITILSAMSKNLAQINEGMQVALEELARLREGQKDAPEKIYEYRAVREIVGLFEALSELKNSKDSADASFVKYAYYRDVFEVYKNVRDARQELLNLEYAVSEAFVFHIPLLFLLELEAYAILTEVLDGLPTDSKIEEFAVNKGSWIAALHDYLTFYNAAISTKVSGSFYQKLSDVRDQLEAYLDEYSGPFVEEIKNGSMEKFVANICHYTRTARKPYGYKEIDDTGVSTVIEGSRETYSLDVREYNFELSKGEVQIAYRNDRHLNDLIDIEDFEAEAAIAQAFGEAQYYDQFTCDLIISSDKLNEEDALADIDLSKFNLLTMRRNLLISIYKMNYKTSLAIYDTVLKYLDDKSLALLT